MQSSSKDQVQKFSPGWYNSSLSSVHFPTRCSSQQLLPPLLLPLRSVVLTVSVVELDQQNRHADGKDVSEPGWRKGNKR